MLLGLSDTDRLARLSLVGSFFIGFGDNKRNQKPYQLHP